LRVKPYGDQALAVEFDNKIDVEVNNQVITLYRHLQGLHGIKYLIPAYHTLTIGLDGTKAEIKAIYQTIEQFKQDYLTQDHLPKETLIIPVCYEAPFDLDTREVEKMTGLTKKEIIKIHSEHTYQVFMLGFLAGFAYMGETDQRIHCSRKMTPRQLVPQGAVGLAGAQTGIYPVQAPGGWQIIGRTPIPLFDPSSAQPAQLKPGLKVRFRAISPDEFKLIELKLSEDIYQLELEDV
jgi:inhibitor of KinA